MMAEHQTMEPQNSNRAIFLDKVTIAVAEGTGLDGRDQQVKNCCVNIRGKRRIVKQS
jgi:hypothetical protein